SAFSFALVMGAAIGAALFMPRKYEAHTRLLSHETTFMTTLSDPLHDASDEGPTRAARERVLARDNLEKIISETDLIRVWQEGRNPIVRVKDAVVQLFVGPWTDEDLMDDMVETLEKRLTVRVGDGTVDIGVTWPEAAMSRRIL